MDLKENHIQTLRTARYFAAGRPDAERIWFVLHGYGQLAGYFIKNFEPVAARGDRVIAPEGLSRFYLGGTYGRVGATWMTKEDRLHEIEDYIRYLDGVYDEVLATHEIQPEIIVLGFSQGTATALRWIRSGKVRPAHLINWAGDLPAEAAGKLPDILADTRLWMRVGDEDEFIPRELAEERKTAIEAIAPDIDFKFFSGTHRIPREALEDLLADMGL